MNCYCCLLSIEISRNNRLEIWWLSCVLATEIRKENQVEPIPAKAPPLSRIVHVPPCTADLSLQTRGKAFFLLYMERGGPHLFNAQACHYYIRSSADSFVLTAHAGT
jgi:hypothetical protein